MSAPENPYVRRLIFGLVIAVALNGRAQQQFPAKEVSTGPTSQEQQVHSGKQVPGMEHRHGQQGMSHKELADMQMNMN